MAGGYRSPAPWLGISASPVTEQGGYYTLPWWQAGGAPIVEKGGYYTLPWWQAGGGVGETPVEPTPTPIPNTDGGGRGSGRIDRKSALKAQQPTPTPLSRPRRGYDQGNVDALDETRRMRILAEDDDIVALITAMLTKGLM